MAWFDDTSVEENLERIRGKLEEHLDRPVGIADLAQLVAHVEESLLLLAHLGLLDLDSTVA